MIGEAIVGAAVIAAGARILKGDPRYGEVVDRKEDPVGWVVGESKKDKKG